MKRSLPRLRRAIFLFLFFFFFCLLFSGYEVLLV